MLFLFNPFNSFNTPKHVIAELLGAVDVVDFVAQLRPGLEILGVPTDTGSDLGDSVAFGAEAHQVVEVLEDESGALTLWDGGQVFAGAQVVGGVTEDPRLAKRPATDHDARAAGGVDHRPGVFG